jgi:type VI secretion system protein ImpC
MAGRMDLELAFGKKTRPQPSGGDGCRILLAAAWSGGHGPARGPIRVDVERFDEVMRGLAPRLTLAAGDPPPTLELTSLDDFHPDQLYRSFDAFAGLRELRRRLLDPSTFAETAARMEGAASTPAPPPAVEGDGDTLTRLLGGRPRASAAPADLGRLLQEIVAPHVVPAIDSQQRRLVGAVDQAAGEHLRALLHHPPFQRLEACWRAAHRLVSTIDPDSEVQIYLLDHPLDAGASELAERLGDSGPWTLIALDDELGPDDAARLPALDATVVAGAAPALLGDDDLTGPLRAHPAAARVALAGPRWLARLPYGAKSDPIEAFAFEELGPDRPHHAFLWASGAFAVAQLVAAAHRQGELPGAVVELDDLPAYTYKEDGESHLQPVAERPLGERAVTALASRGLIPLVSARDRNALRVARFQTLAGTPL